MACASSGCWSKRARSPPRGQKPWQPIGREVPALRGLRLEQPAQRGEADVEHLAIARSSGR